MYNQKVMEIFNNPQNAGVLRGANGVGTASDIVCGDIIRIYLQIENDRIIDAKFKTFGCVASISSSEVLTEMVKNCNLDDVVNITDINIINELEGLPAEKQHCAILAKNSLDEAILDYYKRLEKAQIAK